METTFPATLRETLLVRIVSQTESYLVDVVRDIASKDLSPFRDRNKEVTLSQAEALSFTSIEQFHHKLIEGECRSLGAKNFVDLRKYFKRKFSIDFGPSASVVSHVNEVYARPTLGEDGQPAGPPTIAILAHARYRLDEPASQGPKKRFGRRPQWQCRCHWAQLEQYRQRLAPAAVGQEAVLRWGQSRQALRQLDRPRTR